MDYEILDEVDREIEAIEELYEKKEGLETFINEHKDIVSVFKTLSKTIDLLWITEYLEKRQMQTSFFDEHEKEEILESLLERINTLQSIEEDLKEIIYIHKP